MPKEAVLMGAVAILVACGAAGAETTEGGLSGAAMAQPPGPVPTQVIDVDLPSESTGAGGGLLALRIEAPAAEGGARYPDGAPVVIMVPGGTGAGSLQPFLPLARDVVRIAVLLPGGVDPVGDRRSDGTYDHRGAASALALYDVVRFAVGDALDREGRTLEDALGLPIRRANVGLLGVSNGGNLATAVAAEHGAGLAGRLAYIVQHESPVSSQIATVDLGGVTLHCPPERSAPPPRLNVENPRYIEYGPLTLDVDWRDLAYDAAGGDSPIFHDGTGDGHYSTVVDSSSGCRTPDLDGDGRLTADEDWPLAPFTDGVVRVYSRPVTMALEDRGVFGAGWPRGIATVAGAAEYWDARESVRHYPATVRNIPRLEAMVLASAVDHVQAAADHPHIRQAFEGWSQSGAWVRINPSVSYLVHAAPELWDRRDLPNNRPNTPPTDWRDVSAYAMPEDVADEVTLTAAVWHMADRAELWSVEPTPDRSPSPTGLVSPAPSRTPDASATQTPAPLPSRLYLPRLGNHH
jgi:hypothetical protein